MLLTISRGSRLGVPPSGPYSTSFDLTENPIVEDGGWVLGGDDGGVFQNCQTASGRLIAVGTSPTAYDDNLAIRTGRNPARHYAQGVIYRAGGYNPTDPHELEFLVGFTILASFNCGYEVLFNTAGSFQIIRQNGAIGDFYTGLSVTSHNGGVGELIGGETVRVEYTETTVAPLEPTIEVYIDSVLKASCTDSTAGRIYSSKIQGGNALQSQPGNGFFSRGTGFVAGSFALDSAEYGDL